MPYHIPNVRLEEPKKGGRTRRSKSHHKGHPIPYHRRGLSARRGPAAKGSKRGHSAKWERCVKHVKSQGRRRGYGPRSPYAICTASVGW